LIFLISKTSRSPFKGDLISFYFTFYFHYYNVYSYAYTKEIWKLFQISSQRGLNSVYEKTGDLNIKKILILIVSLFIGNVAFSGEKPQWLNVKSWVYQLCNYKNNKLEQIRDAKFDLAVIDLTRDGSEEYFTKDEIESVKRSGKYVIAYFEIGAIEDYRPEWNDVPKEIKAGAVDGWPKEQYVKFWDKRWWPVVKGRIDQALKSGFDGIYMDLITAYGEIKDREFNTEERAYKMVDLIDKISKYAKKKNHEFKIIAQNCPELYTWSQWKPQLNKKYIDAIDGLGLESVFYMAHDRPANKGWCRENRENAIAVKKAGKLLLGVDYAKKVETIKDAYAKQRKAGFVPYVSVVELDVVLKEGETKSAVKKKHRRNKHTEE
jgi:cysteinyl-tRNA synthetase